MRIGIELSLDLVIERTDALSALKSEVGGTAETVRDWTDTINARGKTGYTQNRLRRWSSKRWSDKRNESLLTIEADILWIAVGAVSWARNTCPVLSISSVKAGSAIVKRSPRYACCTIWTTRYTVLKNGNHSTIIDWIISWWAISHTWRQIGGIWCITSII